MSQLDRKGYGSEADSCFGKTRFMPDQFDRASRTAKAMSRRVHCPLMAYRCPWCSGWHVGRRLKAPEHIKKAPAEAGASGSAHHAPHVL